MKYGVMLANSVPPHAKIAMGRALPFGVSVLLQGFKSLNPIRVSYSVDLCYLTRKSS